MKSETKAAFEKALTALDARTRQEQKAEEQKRWEDTVESKKQETLHQKEMEAKSDEFRKAGSELYL